MPKASLQETCNIIANGIALAVTDELYPQLQSKLAGLNHERPVSADIQELIQPEGCQTIKAAISVRVLKIDDPWDLSRQCHEVDLHSRICNDGALTDIINGIVQGSSQESSGMCRLIVEKKRHEFFRIDIKVFLRSQS
jgi:hypothetical protein